MSGSQILQSRPFKMLSRLLQIGSLPVLGLLIFLIGSLYFVSPVLNAGKPGRMPIEDLPAYLALSLVIWHPVIFYLCGLAALQDVCGRLASGAWASKRVAYGIGVLGGSLILGALASVITKPIGISSAWARETMNAQHLRYPPIGMLLHVDFLIASFVICLMGGVLVLLAFVVARAARAEGELAQIF